MKTKQNKGFTIIELLVTMVIIGILTAIILSNLTNAKSKSRDAKRVSDIAQMQVALELFFDRCNRYPKTTSRNGSTIPDIADPVDQAPATRNGCPANIGLSTFITQIPQAPTPGSEYQYVVNDATTPTDYVLKATLENYNSVLNDDIDGTVLTSASCGASDTTDRSYCAMPR